MSDKPRTPDGWRELLNQSVHEPELTPQQQEGNRRSRRRARKAARIEQRRRTRRAVDAERRREPVTVGGAALILVVIVAIGVGSRWLSDSGQDNSPKASPTVSGPPTQAAPAAPPTPQDSTTASPSPSTSPALSDPEAVAEAWSEAYFTRNPVEDGEHDTVVEHASPWMSHALARNLAGQDAPLWERLVSRGGVSTVTSVTVGPAKDDLPPDTPLRIWREVTIDVDVEAYTNYSDTHTLQAEVTRQDEGEWLVTRVLGL